MTDSTALGDRMKRHEVVYRQLMPRRTYSILRVDGRAFHSYLRDCERPFDETFMADMDAVAEALCSEITGSILAYSQSDEVSVLYTDFSQPGTEAWFGGVLAKQVTIAASLATAVMNEQRIGRRALFDARAFTMSDPVEVMNYFIWRQRDAVRNSISMAAQAKFSHRQLQGVNTGQMQELLWSDHRINWNDYPVGCKRGRTTIRTTSEEEVSYIARSSNELVIGTAVRSRWETSGAEHFTADWDGWLASMIPIISDTYETEEE